MRRRAAWTLKAAGPVLVLLAGHPLAAQSSLELRAGASVESPRFFVGGLDYVRHVTGPLYISGGLATSVRAAEFGPSVVDTGQGFALALRRAESRYLEVPLAVRAEFGGERLRARVGIAAVPGIPVGCESWIDFYVLDAVGRISEKRRGPEAKCSDENVDVGFQVFGRLEAGVQLAVSDRLALLADVGYGFGKPSLEYRGWEMQAREEEWRIVAGVRFALS